jgi:alanine-glyoxylate transaminase / serine-glyoxylate transaminase / serine-pyruvate transaminase
MYGLHEALVILEEEGLENAWARHRAMHESSRPGSKPWA